MNRLFWILVIALAVIGLICSLTSCDLWQSREAETGTEKRLRTYHENGTTEAGIPFTKQGSEEVTVERESTTEKKSGVDDVAIQRAIQAGLAGVTGDIAGLRSAFSAQSKPITGNQTTDDAIAMLLTYLGAKGGITGIAKMRKKAA